MKLITICYYKGEDILKGEGSMNYLVIGVGAIGSVIAKDLAEAENTNKVGLGDINLEFAQELEAEIGEKSKAIHIDIYDEKILRNAIKDYDLVVNATGPFYKTAQYVLEACIAEGIDYVDVADDSAAVELLLTYDDKCKEAGITALICQGVSPGTTNVLALLGSKQLDQTDVIHTNWIVSQVSEANDERSAGSTLYHALEMSTGTNPQFLDGEMVEVESATGTKKVQFNAPVEPYPVHYLGHGEPLTLARNIPGVQTVTNRGNLWPAASDVANLKVFEAIGLAANDPIDVNGVEVNRRDIVFALMQEKPKADPREIEGADEVESQVHVEVTGKKDGKELTYEYTVGAEMNASTGLSASYGAQAVAQATEKKTGVLAPEEYIEIKPYLQFLTDKGFEFYLTVTEDGIKSDKTLVDIQTL